MKIYVPLAHGQTIPHSVYVSLSSQTVGLDIVPCCANGVVDSNASLRPNKIMKVYGELRSRNLALSLIEHGGDDFAIMQDRDIVHLSNYNYSEALIYLQNNRDVGVVSMPWLNGKPDESHIILRAIVFRVDALKNFVFRADERWHMCLTMADDLLKQGWKCVYLPSDEKRLICEVNE